MRQNHGPLMLVREHSGVIQGIIEGLSLKQVLDRDFLVGLGLSREDALRVVTGTRKINEFIIDPSKVPERTTPNEPYRGPLAP